VNRLLPWLWVSLLASTALGQGFELDLSEEKPNVPSALRPSLAVLSVLAADGDEGSIGRARQLEAELLKHLMQSDEFKTVVEPPAAAAGLGPAAESARQCLDYACFDAAAKALKVSRAVRLTVQRSGAASLVVIYGFDPGFNEVLTFEQDSAEKAEKAFLGMGGKSQAQKDREFLKKLVPFVKSSLSKLATPNGKLEVDNVATTFPVQIDGALAGTGSFEQVVQRGPHTVRVEVEGYLPFEQTVSVEPLQTVPVKISLTAKPIARPDPQPSAPRGTTILARPGLYLAVAGAIATAAGVALGQSAVAVNRALASDASPVPVTRAAAKAGVTHALLANILVAVGAAAVVGGTTWVVLTPSFGPDQRPGIEPSESTSINGAVLEFGARF
jgi:hypothetical protein